MVKLSHLVLLLGICALNSGPAAAQLLDDAPTVSRGAETAPLLAPHLAMPAAGPLRPPGRDFDEAAFSGGQYLGMFAGGALGSAVGLLGGIVGAAAVGVATSGCIDCGSGVPRVAYGIAAATTSFGTAVAVASVARPPASMEFGPGLREAIRSDVFTPALIGAAAGIASGALLGAAVQRVSPSDRPYCLVAFNVGQSAASVLAVRIWAAGGRR